MNILKKIGQFLANWSDVLLLLPIAFIVVATNQLWVRQIDPTANTLDAGNLVMLTWNILKFTTVFAFAYFIWQLYFRADIFNKAFWEKLNPIPAAILSIILWIIVLSFSAWLLLQGV